MAVTVTLESGGQKAKRWLVTFGADADTTALLDHGFNGAPDHVNVQPLTPQAYVGKIIRGAVTTTQITITKTVDVGSGGAQVEVIAYIPHSSL